MSSTQHDVERDHRGLCGCDEEGQYPTCCHEQREDGGVPYGFVQIFKMMIGCESSGTSRCIAIGFKQLGCSYADRRSESIPRSG